MVGKETLRGALAYKPYTIVEVVLKHEKYTCSLGGGVEKRCHVRRGRIQVHHLSHVPFTASGEVVMEEIRFNSPQR